MKKLFKTLFYSKSHERLCVIRKKQHARLDRLKDVVKELQEFDDIPISWQFTSLCTTLKIRPDAAAKNFIYELLLSDLDLEKQAKKLPLI